MLITCINNIIDHELNHLAVQHILHRSCKLVSILSLNGKNASEPSVTCRHACASHACFSSFVNTGGFSVNTLLPFSISKNIHIFITNIKINCIISICTFHIFLKWKIKYLWCLTKKPVISLLSCKSCTVNS